MKQRNLQNTLVFEKGIAYILKDLGFELSIRTGFNAKEYEALRDKIKKKDKSELDFDNNENIMLHQMLNEICNGINVPNFQEEFGTPIEEARKLLNSLNNKIQP